MAHEGALSTGTEHGVKAFQCPWQKKTPLLNRFGLSRTPQVTIKLRVEQAEC